MYKSIQPGAVASARGTLHAGILGDEGCEHALRGGARWHLPAPAERDAVARQLAALQLSPVPNPKGCTAYWQGRKRDAWLEGSELDLVFTRGFEASEAWPGAHCGRYRCENFRSTRGQPDPDYTRLSDHCPLVVDLRPKP